MKKETKKKIIFWISIGVVFVLFLIFLSFLSIYADVKASCVRVQKTGQDCVTSLLDTVMSVESGFNEKNTAIWALGQIADQRALHLLLEINQDLSYDGERCDYANEICKSEVERAMKWCNQGNITNWMYKHQEWIK